MKLEEGCYRKKHGVAMRNIRNYGKKLRRPAKRKERTFTEATGGNRAVEQTG